MTHTDLTKLPYLAAAQAQKHVTHNEALRMIDALLQIGVKSRTQNTPPSAPVASDGYIIPVGASGAWDSRQTQLAVYQDGAWMYFEPVEGWLCWVEDEAALMVYSNNQWDALSAGGGSANPIVLGVNATATPSQRLAVSSLTSLFTHEGNDHRISINKTAVADTASIVFRPDIPVVLSWDWLVMITFI